ncbi:AraC family transcriptional regulator [Actinosynnema sp. NPDC050436]|uniref:helix-turn-helix transcriptional regulator n=1 Tax=Actinosynnema sp. NPDC050436 TaxID=3155659 RepID=UPI0033FD800F
MQPETFDSHDLVQVEDFVSKIYSKMRIGAVGACTRARIDRRVFGLEVGFDNLDYSFDMTYAADPADLLIVCDVLSSTVRVDDGGGEETFASGDQFLISRPGLPYAGEAHSARLRFTLLDPALLDLVAAADGGTGPVRVLGHRPVSPGAQLRLQSTIAYVRDVVMPAPDLPVPPLIVSTASQYLAARVLQTYPNTACATAGPGDRRDAGPTALQRAVVFIEANPDTDISVADIARAACVTPRAIRLAFRRHLDSTPTASLRRVRLDHAHTALEAAEPGTVTVTAIAARWGYASPSRFAADYRAAYGRQPRQTLHGLS